MAWEVVDKSESLEVVYRWFNTKEGTEAFGLKLISRRRYSDHQIKNKLINRTNEKFFKKLKNLPRSVT